MLITRLELLAGDLVPQRDFYANVLGLPVHLDADSLLVQAGKTELVFALAPSGWKGAYHFCFNIPENQFVYARAWLSARIPLLKDEAGNDEFHSESWNSDAIYFKDAGGNILELIARHDLKNGVQAPFNSEQVLQVSEIGLPSRDVISFAKDLCEKLGLSIYRQEASESFTPIGDAEGLFILPAENRIWMPNTGVPARMLPVKIKFEINGKSFNLRGLPYELS